MLQHQHSLKTLSLGALGGGQGNTANIGNSSAMTMSDQVLQTVTDILAGFSDLETHLNLAGITRLQSSDLAGLMCEDSDDQSPLETLNLNNTGIDDDASSYISTCSQLRSLEVQGTKFSEEGLFTLIDSCSNLERLVTNV
ncbi:hypothetical protein ONZ45_g845 [Pleurotus djamor]|nr:hypothetical protein ONZ45_g845 [Pleurotus djamor]